tara:strand:- start:4 stop:174 length:171 start_codon:yes stop_codon:yes gene_type:complete
MAKIIMAVLIKKDGKTGQVVLNDHQRTTLLDVINQICNGEIKVVENRDLIIEQKGG